MLSNSISEGKSAYQAEYVVTEDRAIGSITLFGSKIRDFNVKVRNKKFIVHEIERCPNGFKTHLSFNVEGEFKGSEVVLDKTIDHITEIASRHPMTPEEIARIAVSYYVEKLN